MDPLDIASLFHALKEGEVRDLELQDGNLQFRVFLPRLAAHRGEGYTHFLCSLAAIGDLSLQPFRNESTEIKDLKQIGQLQLRIEGAEVTAGGQVKVFCAHRAGGSGARLTFKAAKFTVWDESFDALSAPELAILRGKG
jgi:hypothetical protein